MAMMVTMAIGDDGAMMMPMMRVMTAGDDHGDDC